MMDQNMEWHKAMPTRATTIRPKLTEQAARIWQTMKTAKMAISKPRCSRRALATVSGKDIKATI